jgi:hypothetical protein
VVRVAVKGRQAQKRLAKCPPPSAQKAKPEHEGSGFRGSIARR